MDKDPRGPGLCHPQRGSRCAHPEIKSTSIYLPGKPGDDLAPGTLNSDAGTNFSAYVPDLPGCVATGSTVAETEQAIREAIALHLEGLREDGSPIPPASSQVEYVEVAA
jgi:predicted RNase H-like HicB family nuclease